MGVFYSTGDKADDTSLAVLLDMLRDKNLPSVDAFFAIREVVNINLRQKSYAKLVNFLSQYIENHPNNEYNAYYMLAIADAYLRQDAYPMAVFYLDRIVKNEKDVFVQGKSVHLECLKQLMDMARDPVKRAWYYEEAISRFKAEIDAPSLYFHLGRTYEELGEWNKAISCYENFLPYYIVSIQGYPDAYAYAKQLVDFNNSPKNWGIDGLPTMLRVVKSALDAGNIRQLWQYRARVNFFARSWAHTDGDDAGRAELNLSTFATSNKIRYADNLESSSNANEAYLRTQGWSSVLTSVWYFYFRKIYFPPDPEIHGMWEWAGIYYGERF